MDFLRRPSRMFRGNRRGNRREGTPAAAAAAVEEEDDYRIVAYYDDDQHEVEDSDGHGLRDGDDSAAAAAYDDYDDDGNDNFHAFVRAEHEYDELHRKTAEEVERTIGGAIDVAERSQGSLLCFHQSTKERATEMGRRVSSLRSLEGYNEDAAGHGQQRPQLQQQQQRPQPQPQGRPQLLNDEYANDDTDGTSSLAGGGSSIASYRSKESLPTFLKVPKVEPGMILRMNSWESYVGNDDDNNSSSSSNNNNNNNNGGNHHSFDDDGRLLGGLGVQRGGGAVHSTSDIAAQDKHQPREVLSIVGAAAATAAGGGNTHRSWAKLRQEEAKKKKQSGRRGRGERRSSGGDGRGSGGILKVLRRSTTGGKNSATTSTSKGGIIRGFDENDSDTSPEDAGNESPTGGDISADHGDSNSDPLVLVEGRNNDIDGGFGPTTQCGVDGSGLERQDSWWARINFNTGDEEDDIDKSLPSSSSHLVGSDERKMKQQSTVPIAPITCDGDDNVPQRLSEFEAREVSVEVSLEERLSKDLDKQPSRLWPRSFLKKKDKDKGIIKRIPAESDDQGDEPLSRQQRDADQNVNHYDSHQSNQRPTVVSNTDTINTHNNNDDDDIAVTREQNTLPKQGCDDGKGPILEVLTLGDAFVDWTLQACEPGESAACFPSPEHHDNNDPVEDDREEVEILCGDTQCMDADGNNISF